MSATDAKVQAVIAESLGISLGQLLVDLQRRLLADETERTGRLQSFSIHRDGSARALYVYHTRDFTCLADVAAYARGQ